MANCYSWPIKTKEETKVSNINDKILKINEVAEIVGRSKQRLWVWWAKDKSMPEPLKINGRAIGWRESTIIAWLESLDGNQSIDRVKKDDNN